VEETLGPEKLRLAFQEIATCDACDAGALPVPTALTAVGGGGRLCGFARTAHLASGDNLGLQVQAAAAEPGDVLVAVGAGDGCAVVGELLSLRARAHGAVGIVVDGLARDADELALPVFARGAQPRRPVRRAYLSLDETVDLLGVPVAPGDLVLADRDGVAVVPRGQAEAILRRARAVVEDNVRQRAEIAEGRLPDWLGEALAARTRG